MRISFFSSSLYKLFSALAVTAVVIVSTRAAPAFAADTGLNSPTACTSATGNWSGPENATASDDLYSKANSTNKVLDCAFNLPAIPSGGIIAGIEVNIEGSSSGAREAVAELSWDGGTSYTTSNHITTFTATEATLTLGGAANTWGRTWAVGDFTSANFRVMLTTNTGNGIISLDHIQVKVYYTADTTPPQTTIISTTPSSSPTSSTTMDIVFSSNEAGSTFQCRLDGGAYASCTSPADLAGLGDGSHTFEVYATDATGNDDPTPASHTWTVDTNPPDTSIDSAPANPSNDSSPTFSFSSADGTATFECQVDGAGFSTCSSGSSFGPLGDGSHTFEVRAVDPAGNTDPTPASHTWTVDSDGPAVTINQASGQADPANSSPINFTVVFSEPVTGFGAGDVSLAGTAGATTALVTESAPNDGTTYTVGVSGMSGDGTVIVTVGEGVAVDASNNGNTASTSTDNTVTYNTSAPDTAIDSNPPASTNSQNADFTFSSPAADLAGFECQLDGGGWSGCTTPRDYLGLGAGSHTFAVRAFDVAGNYDPSPASYTWTVDLGFPTVLFTTNTVPANNVTLSSGPTQVTVEFSEDVKNDGSADAANSAVNYLLVEDGANNTFNTFTCSAGLVADDTNITVNSASYTNNGGVGPFIATLNVNGGVPLPSGTYRLFVCGTTSIEDLSGNELNDGSRDTTITFTVQPINQGGGGGGGNSGGTTSTGEATSLGGFLIPVTGFPQGKVTSLAAQSADKAYASTDILIEIPKLGLKTTIVGVPQSEAGWDVSWLGSNAGWLNGSAFPTWKGNSVITAHVWDAYNRPGPFAGLIDLQYGDQIRIHAYGQVYTYEITESSLILPSGISSAFRHEEKSVLTLITCEGYQEKTGAYTHRRLVRAVLVKVEKAQ